MLAVVRNTQSSTDLRFEGVHEGFESAFASAFNPQGGADSRGCTPALSFTRSSSRP
jgi:hypothetical protein